MKSILSSALLAALLFLDASSAAEREIEIRCVVGGENARAAIEAAGGPRPYHIHDPAGTKKLGSVALRTNFGVAPWAEHFVADDGPLVLSTDPDPASAKNPEQVVGSFTVPAGTKSLVLLVVPRGPKIVGSHTVAFDESAATFPPGSIKLVNFSPNPNRWSLDSQKKTELASGTAETLILQAPQNANAGPLVSLRCHVHGKDGWMALYAGSRPIAPNRREILMVYALPGSPNLEVVGIPE